MSIVLPALSVAFAAFVVWLTVRIVNRRERWAKWTLAATLALPVLYVASLGPVFWVAERTRYPQWARHAHNLYVVPLELLYDTFPETAEATIEPYLRLWRE
jgi:ABC-type Fe3+ transport system permease subunit